MAADGAFELDSLMHIGDISEEDADDRSSLLPNSARMPCSCSGRPWRLGAVGAWVVIGMLLAGAVAQKHFAPGLRATWSGASDGVGDFDFDLGDSFEKLKNKMKGLTGTCLSGTECNGNTGAVQQSCDENGSCKPLGMVFCCTDPASKITATLDDAGEVSCSCSTTSEAITGLEHKLKGLKKESIKVMNKVKALTGQCLLGEQSCEGRPLRYTYKDTLYCCPAGYTNMTKTKTGVSLICMCH